MKPVLWELVSCADHKERNRDLVEGTSTQVFAARNGCQACRIQLSCTRCDWTSRHVLWSSALASETNHGASCPN